MSWTIIVTLPDGEPAFIDDDGSPLIYETEAEALANLIEFRELYANGRRAKIVELP